MKLAVDYHLIDTLMPVLPDKRRC